MSKKKTLTKQKTTNLNQLYEKKTIAIQPAIKTTAIRGIEMHLISQQPFSVDML